MFLQQTINGLSIGSVYALMAVGYSLIYSLLNFTNFAHAVAVTAGAYVSYFLYTQMQPYLIAGILVSLAGGMFTSVLIEIVIYRTMLNRKNSKKLYLTLAGWGVSTVAENLVVIFIGSLSRFYPNALTTMDSIQIGKQSIGKIDLIILFVSVIGVLALQAYITYSRDGLAMRGAAYDLRYAKLMGVNTDVLLIKVFAIAGMLAGVAGIFMGIKYTAYPTLGSVMTTRHLSRPFSVVWGAYPAPYSGLLLLE